jgi:hypothetical protein
MGYPIVALTASVTGSDRFDVRPTSETSIADITITQDGADTILEFDNSGVRLGCSFDERASHFRSS